MGGAVSSGRDNNELVDNLMSGNYIRTRNVERVFRALDRADFMSPDARDQAYKDLAWRHGPLHLSAPCIYSEVMEALELKPGLSFLNIGSGTGYLTTLVGLIIGSSGISHGVEASPAVYEYANTKLFQFIEHSCIMDDFDFCIPKYYTGNGLCLAPSHTYDRVYCGAGVVVKYENYFKQFIKVGGVLVMPLADQLVQLRRVSATRWTRRNLLNVSFAHLSEPAPADRDQSLTLDEQSPPPLQVLSRGVVRAAMRGGVMRRHAELREPPPNYPPPRQGPRRICIPYAATSNEELSELHDLDEAEGAHEMNALLSLVLSMGQNRAAGSLRFEHGDEVREPDHQRADEDVEEGDPPAVPARVHAEDDYIVFDVGVRAGPRRRARAPRRTPSPPARTPAPPPPPPPPPGDTPPPADAAPADHEPGANPEYGPISSSDGSPTASGASPTTSGASPTASGASPTARRSSVPAPPRARAPPRPRAPPPRSRAPPPRPRAPPPRPRAPPRRSDRPRIFWSDLSSSEDDSTQVRDSKRQKLDSGIGEGTASSGASPDKSDKTSHDTHSSNTDDDGNDSGDTDMPWAEGERERESESASSGAGSESEGDSEWEAGAAVADVIIGGNFGKRVLDATAQRCCRTTHGALRRRGGGAEAGARTSRPSQSDSGAEEGEAAGAGAGAGPSARACRGEGACSCAETAAEARGNAADARRVRLSLAMKRACKELPLPHALKKYINYGRCYQF